MGEHAVVGLVIAACLAVSMGAAPDSPRTGQHSAMAIPAPFALDRETTGDTLDLKLRITSAPTQAYRYELMVDGSNHVRTAGQVGPASRVGAIIAHVRVSARQPWQGTLTITDVQGERQTIDLK